MADVITIKDLEIETHIGVPEEERATAQHLLVTIELSTSTQEAGITDDISKSIDYQEVVDSVKNLATVERKTIEKLAEDIATHVQKDYNCSPVSVMVKKFIIPETEYVAVSITRP